MAPLRTSATNHSTSWRAHSTFTVCFRHSASLYRWISYQWLHWLRSCRCQFHSHSCDMQRKAPEWVSSIFQAEGQAILQAIRFATTIVPKPKFIEIFSDSRAALVSSLCALHQPVSWCSHSALLPWQPSSALLDRRGHQGNEIVDLLAKNALYEKCRFFFPTILLEKRHNDKM